MNLNQIMKIATEVSNALAPACERLKIAGSIRRRKPNPKDVEIVYIPTMVERQVDLFTVVPVPATDEVIAGLVQEGILAWDTEVKRNGPKHKRLIHRASGVVVELFKATPENWGLQLVLRTGPGDFNKVLVSKPWYGGAMPVNMKMEGGYLWRNGERLDSPTEEAFFGALGLPHWRPEERTVERLREYLAAVKFKGGSR